MQGNLLVIKIGGAEGLDLPAVCRDIERLLRKGARVIVVHGGSSRVDQMASEAGLPVRYLTSPSGYVSRYTDPKMRDVYVSALRTVNAELLGHLDHTGLHAVGLTLAGCCVLLGERKRHLRHVRDGRAQIIRDDFSGLIREVRRKLIHEILAFNQVPVIPALAHSQQDGFLNVDGDRAAAEIAGAVGADLFICLSNVAGLFRDFPHQKELIRHVSFSEIDSALDWARGRMRQKVMSMKRAAQGGVPRAAIADGRRSNPLLAALAGGGTWFGIQRERRHSRCRPVTRTPGP
jgi:acetylglutamate/LysW-gamma-L-alpha-aminoadipate kinase